MSPFTTRDRLVVSRDRLVLSRDPTIETRFDLFTRKFMRWIASTARAAVRNLRLPVRL